MKTAENTVTETDPRDAGIDLRGAKNAAIRRLSLEIPAALVADAFGYSYQVTEIHSNAAGKRFADYPALSADSSKRQT